jgi:hypothetical protein
MHFLHLLDLQPTARPPHSKVLLLSFSSLQPRPRQSTAYTQHAIGLTDIKDVSEILKEKQINPVFLAHPPPDDDKDGGPGDFTSAFTPPPHHVMVTTPHVPKQQPHPSITSSQCHGHLNDDGDGHTAHHRLHHPQPPPPPPNSHAGSQHHGNGSGAQSQARLMKG